MSLKTEINGTVHFFQLLNAMEGIVIQASLYNPTAHRHFCERDAERLDGLANAVRTILTSRPKPDTVEVCNCCHGAECPTHDKTSSPI